MKQRGEIQKISEDQLNTIENIKHLYKSRKRVIKFFNDFANIRLTR